MTIKLCCGDLLFEWRSVNDMNHICSGKGLSVFTFLTGKESQPQYKRNYLSKDSAGIFEHLIVVKAFEFNRESYGPFTREYNSVSAL